MPFDRSTGKDILAHALGSTLYMPATRSEIAEEIISRKNEGLISMVICLEDAIGDNELGTAENNVIEQIKILDSAVKEGRIHDECIPLIFVRVRAPEQITVLSERLGNAINILTGFVFPKFSQINGWDYFNTLHSINSNLERPLYGMPILETSDIIYIESRLNSLVAVKQILDQFSQIVLNIRIGGTDFSNLFGIRRGCDTTIYDITVIRNCISDIINLFCRAEDEYVVSGPVWEYFTYSGVRALKPQLRESIFENEHGNEGKELRSLIINHYMDGLIREVLLDKANGLTGKTIIHPSHITPVQALNVVTYEEYADACSILDNNNGNLGVIKSGLNNKMNEIKSHTNWAKKIIKKSKIYGVFNENHNFTSLLS